MAANKNQFNFGSFLVAIGAEILLASRVDDVLDTMTPREASLIRMRFGLGVDVKSVAEIAVVLGISRARAYQIEKKAIHKLRHPSRSRRLFTLLTTPTPIICSRCERQMEFAALNEPERVKAAVALKYRNTPVEELELSVRAYNALGNCGIVTIGELIQQSEVMLLRSRSMGRKALMEIKQVLELMGLSLGMRIIDLSATEAQGCDSPDGSRMGQRSSCEDRLVSRH